jgi:hypothetical protein
MSMNGQAYAVRGMTDLDTEGTIPRALHMAHMQNTSDREDS